MKIPNIPIDMSNNIQDQISEWQIEYVMKLMSNYVSREKAMETASEAVKAFIESKFNDKSFRSKLADDIIELAVEDPELLKVLWEKAKVDAPKKMDEAMDKFNKGQITKEEMEKQLEFHSIVYKEVDWSK